MGGKKGKMTDYGSAHEKWKGTEYLRELPTALAYARRTSRDESAIQSKIQRDALLNRKSRNYSFLNYMIENRLSDDVREDAGDRKWIHTLTSTSARDLKSQQDKVYNAGKKVAALIVANTYLKKRKMGELPTLHEICVDAIATNLRLYETSTLQKVFCDLPPETTELLSCFGAQHETICDENLECVSNTMVKFLVLGEAISDVGISKLSLFRKNYINSFYEERENWWESCPDSHDVPLYNFTQKQLVLMGCSLTFSGLALIKQQFRSLESLIIHGVNFKFGFDAIHGSFPSIFCESFAGWPCLTELHLSYCPWVSIDSLETLIGRIRGTHEFRRTDGRIKGDIDDFAPHLVKLSKIVVFGLYDIDVTLNRVEDIVHKFHVFCNIALVVKRGSDL
jgi:hypothetical protein